jgi:hypothetical protein
MYGRTPWPHSPAYRRQANFGQGQAVGLHLLLATGEETWWKQKQFTTFRKYWS